MLRPYKIQNAKDLGKQQHSCQYATYSKEDYSSI